MRDTDAHEFARKGLKNPRPICTKKETHLAALKADVVVILGAFWRGVIKLPLKKIKPENNLMTLFFLYQSLLQRKLY